MPKKSKRVAARQAQLSGRAKRVRTRGPAGIPEAKSPPSDRQTHAVSWPEAEAQLLPGRAPVEASPPVGLRSTPTPSPRARTRSLQARPIETYIVPELRRIGVTTGVIFVIMAVLVFVLQ